MAKSATFRSVVVPGPPPGAPASVNSLGKSGFFRIRRMAVCQSPLRSGLPMPKRRFLLPRPLWPSPGEILCVLRESAVHGRWRAGCGLRRCCARPRDDHADFGEVIPSEEPGCRDGDRSCRAAFALHGCAAIDHAIPRLYPSKEAISLAGQPVVGTTRNRAGWNAMNRGIES